MEIEFGLLRYASCGRRPLQCKGKLMGRPLVMVDQVECRRLGNSTVSFRACYGGGKTWRTAESLMVSRTGQACVGLVDMGEQILQAERMATKGQG